MSKNIKEREDKTSEKVLRSTHENKRNINTRPEEYPRKRVRFKEIVKIIKKYKHFRKMSRNHRNDSLK